MRRIRASCKNFRTICEVFRDVNDLVQENTEKDGQIRDLLLEAFGMGKKLVTKLVEYNEKACHDFWGKNSRHNRRIKQALRRDINYKVGKDGSKP